MVYFLTIALLFLAFSGTFFNSELRMKMTHVLVGDNSNIYKYSFFQIKQDTTELLEKLRNYLIERQTIASPIIIF